MAEPPGRGSQERRRPRGRRRHRACHERVNARAQAAPLPGSVTTWKDEQGYGFITPNGGGPAVFLHVSAVGGGGRPARATSSPTTCRPATRGSRARRT
ncbi:cold shock domain-containing protein [Massilia sp. Dwa41.01b]|uniref:cold-shock protein n=1 Tax=Massilia sp. Dwa41.01b TaxID=2709302 RepID=UPI001602B692|nr:cold shock domain-containing protein [Massilia sp. Dwa41.01b]